MSIYRPLKCLRCGHEWVARIMNVGLCPRCKSRLWNQPKKTQSPRLDSKSDLERIKDLFLEMGVLFRSADLQSVSIEPDEGQRKSDADILKSRYEIKVAGVSYLFDEKGIFLGIDSGAKFLPRK